MHHEPNDVRPLRAVAEAMREGTLHLAITDPWRHAFERIAPQLEATVAERTRHRGRPAEPAPKRRALALVVPIDRAKGPPSPSEKPRGPRPLKGA